VELYQTEATATANQYSHGLRVLMQIDHRHSGLRWDKPNFHSNRQIQFDPGGCCDFRQCVSVHRWPTSVVSFSFHRSRKPRRATKIEVHLYQVISSLFPGLTL